MYRLLLSILLLPLFSFAQINKDYQGLLWKISGNGLEEPSYLYGTMHVSNRVAFHLSETFFDALDNADIIALETNRYPIRRVCRMLPDPGRKITRHASSFSPDS